MIQKRLIPLEIQIGNLENTLKIQTVILILFYLIMIKLLVNLKYYLKKTINLSIILNHNIKLLGKMLYVFYLILTMKF